MLPFHSGFFLLLSNDIIHTHNGFGLSVGLSPSVPMLNYTISTYNSCDNIYQAFLYSKQ